MYLTVDPIPTPNFGIVDRLVVGIRHFVAIDTDQTEALVRLPGIVVVRAARQISLDVTQARGRAPSTTGR